MTRRSLVNKLYLSPILLAYLAVLATCEGVDNISVPATGRSVIPQRTVLDELLGNLAFVGFEGFDISQSQEFRNQGYSKEQVDSVRMESFTLTIESPATANFDFLQSIRFHASADGLPQVEIARLDAIPPGSNVLELEVDTTVELQPYVIAPSVTITTTATGTRPPEETTIEAVAMFDIDVNVNGACE